MTSVTLRGFEPPDAVPTGTSPTTESADVRSDAGAGGDRAMIGDWTAARPQAHLRLPAQGLLARGSRLRRYDWVLTAAVLSLSAIGVLLVAAATRPLDPRHPYGTAEHQVLFLVIGLMLAVAASLADYRSIRALAPVIYGLALLGLAATFVIGTDVQWRQGLDQNRRRPGN